MGRSFGNILAGLAAVVFTACSSSESENSESQAVGPLGAYCLVTSPDYLGVIEVPTNPSNQWEVFEADKVATQYCWKNSTKTGADNCYLDFRYPLDSRISFGEADSACFKRRSSFPSVSTKSSKVQPRISKSERALVSRNEFQKWAQQATSESLPRCYVSLFRARVNFTAEAKGTSQLEENIAMNDALNKCGDYVQAQKQAGNLYFTSECRGVFCVRNFDSE